MSVLRRLARPLPAELKARERLLGTAAMLVGRSLLQELERSGERPVQVRVIVRETPTAECADCNRAECHARARVLVECETSAEVVSRVLQRVVAADGAICALASQVHLSALEAAVRSSIEIRVT